MTSEQAAYDDETQRAICTGNVKDAHAFGNALASVLGGVPFKHWVGCVATWAGAKWTIGTIRIAAETCELHRGDRMIVVAWSAIEAIELPPSDKREGA